MAKVKQTKKLSSLCIHNQEQVTNWQKVLIYLDENKDKHFTDHIAYLIEIYNLTNKNK